MAAMSSRDPLFILNSLPSAKVSTDRTKSETHTTQARLDGYAKTTFESGFELMKSLDEREMWRLGSFTYFLPKDIIP
jgi:hypothetical protein